MTGMRNLRKLLALSLSLSLLNQASTAEMTNLGTHNKHIGTMADCLIELANPNIISKAGSRVGITIGGNSRLSLYHAFCTNPETSAGIEDQQESQSNIKKNRDRHH